MADDKPFDLDKMQPGRMNLLLAIRNHVVKRWVLVQLDDETLDKWESMHTPGTAWTPFCISASISNDDVHEPGSQTPRLLHKTARLIYRTPKVQ